MVEEKFRRATPGGTGGVKAITNYAIVSINNSIPIIVLHLHNIYKLLNKWIIIILLIWLQIYKPISEAKAKGFTDVLFLDAVTGKYVEEASTSNIFVVKVRKCSNGV